MLQSLLKLKFELKIKKKKKNTPLLQFQAKKNSKIKPPILSLLLKLILNILKTLI